MDTLRNRVVKKPPFLQTEKAGLEFFSPTLVLPWEKEFEISTYLQLCCDSEMMGLETSLSPLFHGSYPEKPPFPLLWFLPWEGGFINIPFSPSLVPTLRRRIYKPLFLSFSGSYPKKANL